MTQHLETYNAQFSSTDPSEPSLPATGLGTVLSSYVGSGGYCYNYRTGAQASCFSSVTQGGCVINVYSCTSPGQLNLTPGTAPAGSPAAKAGAHWLVTENGQSAQVDHVQPEFSSLSLTDLWQPNDKLTFNIGARVDDFTYLTDDLESGYPARQFWFTAYNREHCGALGFTPVPYVNGVCPAGTKPLTDPGNGLYNVGAGSTTTDVFQPRVSGTWALNPDTVIRGSYGKYARAEASSYFQYNTYQQNLASFISQFYAYGFHTPDHNLSPDTSNNFDLSLEKHLRGTNMSFKLTPFYRSTQNQLQQLAIDPLGGTLAGLNVGTQKTYGVEFSFQGGDFAKNGLSYLLSYTYTNSRITFHPYNGVSIIDTLNSPIEQYNSYTKACAGVTASSSNWAACGSGLFPGNAAPTLPAGTKRHPIAVANPYYDQPIQPLFDPNGSYAPSNVIPSPFNGANSYEVPNVVSLVLNYRRDKFAFTPTLRYDDGPSYGSPLVWPGYVPQSCTAQPSATPLTPGVNCPGGAVFLPDPYNGNRFDNLNSFKDPSQVTLNLQASYDVSPRVSITASAVNVYNKCFQRGYAWDNAQTCVYSNLPSNILAPSGNFLKTSAAGIPEVAPIQTRYPYGTFFDITEVGASSVIQPFNFFVTATVKL
jgi:outer membrane receptor protein involved in Fe transport